MDFGLDDLSAFIALPQSEELKLRDMKLDKQDKERLDMEETIRAKERVGNHGLCSVLASNLRKLTHLSLQDIRDKLQVISNLRQRITNSDQVLAEGQSVVETMDKSYRNKLEERNELLVKIQTSIDALLNEEQRLTVVGMSVLVCLYVSS